MKKPKVRVAQDVIASPRPRSDAPLTPARFNAYYINTDNLEQSSRIRFLSKLWSLILSAESALPLPD
jgi:hypothetical protein